MSTCVEQPREPFAALGIGVEELYLSTFPLVARFVSKKGGSFEEAKDVFQEALIIYLEKASDTSEIAFPEKYIFGISRILWKQNMRDRERHTGLDAAAEAVPGESGMLPATEKLLNMVAQTSRKCLALLKSFYFDRLPATDIAQKLGFSSTHSMAVQKYKCIEKLRDIVQSKRLSYEDFFE